MDWQLDHVFLAVRDLAAAEQLIAEFGMAFSQRGAHRGQGTINACAMFENGFFELLRPLDDAELLSDVVKPWDGGREHQSSRLGDLPLLVSW